MKTFGELRKKPYICNVIRREILLLQVRRFLCLVRSLNRCKIKIPLPVAASRGTVKLLKATNLERGVAKVAIF